MDVPHYWNPDQISRLLDALAAHNRYRARTAALIMWRSGLRISEALALEWRDLDYLGSPPTLLVRRSKSRRPRTVRLHPDLVQLFLQLAGQPLAPGPGARPGDADRSPSHWRRHSVGRVAGGVSRHRPAPARRA